MSTFCSLCKHIAINAYISAFHKPFILQNSELKDIFSEISQGKVCICNILIIRLLYNIPAALCGKW